jgi:hypothetical protein
MDIRLAPAEHYDQAFKSLEDARRIAQVVVVTPTDQCLDAIAECLLGLLRVEMARLETLR